MTDYARELSIGEQQLIRRGTRPSDGWRNRTVIQLEASEQALLTGGTMPTKRRPRGSGGPTTPTPPPVTPPGNAVLGYARVAMLASGHSGGSISVDDIHTPAADATLYTCTTFAQLRSALLATGKRFIKVVGSALLDGAGAEFSVTKPHFTVDFIGYTGGGVKDYKMVVKCGDNIWTEGKLAPGEGSTVAKSTDRRGLSFNAGNDGVVISEICVDHMSVMWGPDVVGSMINNVEDATVQFSMLGPALFDSNVGDGAIAGKNKGYGWNVTVPGNSDPSTIYPKRLTFYRNLYPLNRERNLKFEHALGVDALECVVFDYGPQAPLRGNARGVNCINCIFKKGPETPSGASGEKGFEANPDAAHGGYDQYPNSTYHSGNIGMTAAGGSFTPTWADIDSGALRATPYDGGPTDPSHGGFSLVTADATLFAAVVAAAGRTYQDTVDTTVKAHVMAGTSDGYYNGAGYAAPHPSWG